MITALRQHWPEYLMEAFGLGAFMISACLVTAFFEHPRSPARAALPSSAGRRVLIGIAMGLTAIAIIYSPWGARSGAHINPAVTLAFLRLGRIAAWDALFYVLAQFAGGALGVVVSYALLPAAVRHPSVNFVITTPGKAGPFAALVAEAVISFLLMLTVLTVGQSRFAPYTGVAAGCLVATYIAVEAPYSGMSMNPARTVASAIVARRWTAGWIYFVAPAGAMLIAAEVHLRWAGASTMLEHGAGMRGAFCDFVPTR
jgi:aquaporin Z